jgi:hypothetical protein
LKREAQNAENNIIPKIFIDEKLNDTIPISETRVKVYDEVLKVKGTIHNKKTQLKPFFDTTNQRKLILPTTKAYKLIGSLSEEKRIEIAVNKRNAEQKSQSFIFMNEMIKLFYSYNNQNVYYQMIVEMRLWAKRYLFVWDSKSSGSVNLNYILPIYTSYIRQSVPMYKRFLVSSESFDDMNKHISILSSVLSQIVPELHLEVIDHGAATLNDGKSGHYVELVAKRGNRIIPLCCESDGVKKLVATLGLLIKVYNEQSATVAYDEFDSGVFEFLLGEILQVVQSSGKGQFIFTSHNMRPLEVLKKDYIWFTTTNPNDRYTKLSNIGGTNNLRRVYYRELAFHEHYDNLYNETKRNLIVSALRQAGGN